VTRSGPARVANDPVAIAAVGGGGGPRARGRDRGHRLVLGGRSAAANGARVHLADPQGLNWGRRRVTNDERRGTAWTARPPRTRLDVHHRAVAFVIDAEHVDRGQADHQLAHARRVDLHRALCESKGVKPSDPLNPVPRPVGRQRALTPRSEGVGIDGGAASAEEAAVHIVEP
jgi:hypothetical protein